MDTNIDIDTAKKILVEEDICTRLTHLQETIDEQTIDFDKDTKAEDLFDEDGHFVKSNLNVYSENMLSSYVGLPLDVVEEYCRQKEIASPLQRAIRNCYTMKHIASDLAKSYKEAKNETDVQRGRAQSYKDLYESVKDTLREVSKKLDKAEGDLKNERGYIECINRISNDKNLKIARLENQVLYTRIIATVGFAIIAIALLIKYLF